MAKVSAGKFAITLARIKMSRNRFMALAVQMLLVVSVFCMQVKLTSELNANGGVEMLNRFFDSDSAWYLTNFETGDQKYGSYGGRGPVHPNVANVIHPLVLVGAKIAGLFDRQSYPALAKYVALCIAPAAAGFRSGLLFCAFVTFGLGFADALLGTILASVAFSSLLFGCLPESFGISGMLFALLYLLTGRSLLNRRVDSRSWVVLGTVFSSTTVTNIVAFAIGLFTVLRRAGARWNVAAKTTAVLSGIALLTTLIGFFALTAAHGSFRGVGRRVGQLDEVRFSVRSMILKFPRALVYSLVPVRPNQLTGTDEENRSNELRVVRFTYRDDLDNILRDVPTIQSYQRCNDEWLLTFWAAMLILIAVLLSSRVLLYGTGAIRCAFQMSLGLLGFNWLLHSFFGLELILYSQHWIIPLVVLMCCGLAMRGLHRWLLRAVLLAVIILETGRSAAVFSIFIHTR